MDGVKCQLCDLRIQERAEGAYTCFKPGFAMPMTLTNHKLIKQAYETRLCPLCGNDTLSS